MNFWISVYPMMVFKALFQCEPNKRYPSDDPSLRGAFIQTGNDQSFAIAPENDLLKNVRWVFKFLDTKTEKLTMLFSIRSSINKS
jgi:hypothetical protein